MKARIAILIFSISTAFSAVPTSRMIPWSRSICGVPGGIPARSTIFTNVVQMGADTNGVVDCTTIFANACSLCPSNQVVYVPPGRYKVSTFTILKNNITLRGENVTNCIIEVHTSQFGIAVGIDSNPFPNSALPSITAGATKGSTSVTLSDASTFSVGNIAELRAFWPVTNQAMSVFGPTLVTGTTSSGDHNLDRRSGLCQTVLVTAKVGNVLTITPPLVETFTNSPVAMWYSGKTTNTGIENLTISHRMADGTPITTAAASVLFNQTVGCWLKDVESYYSPRKHVVLIKSVLGEVRDSFVNISTANGPNGEAIDLSRGVAGFMVENNRGYRVCPMICLGDADSGVVGNAILYNYAWASQATSDFTTNGIVGPDINCHGYYATANLIEGNFGGRYQSDSYTGSNQKQTLFRNWWWAVHTNGYINFRIPVAFDRFNLNNNAGANLLGTNSLTWDVYTLDGEASQSIKGIWRPGYPLIGGNGYGAYYLSGTEPNWFWPGTWSGTYATNMVGAVSAPVTSSTTIPGTFTIDAGLSICFQNPSATNSYVYAVTATAGSGGNFTTTEAVTVASGAKVYILDRGAWDYNKPEVLATLIRAGNYDYKTLTLDTDPAWDTFAASLFADYVSSPPDWWPSTLRFPSVQPADSTKVTMNPAEARFWGVSVIPPVTSGGGVVVGGGVRLRGGINLRSTL